MLFRNAFKYLSIMILSLIIMLLVTGALSYAQTVGEYQIDAELSFDGDLVSSPEEVYKMRGYPINACVKVTRSDDTDRKVSDLYCGIYQDGHLVSVKKERVILEIGEKEKEWEFLPDLYQITSVNFELKFYLWESGSNSPLCPVKDFFAEYNYIFVSQQYGNDSNDGSFKHPLKTITNAKKLARKMSEKPTDIILREGDYSESVSFDRSDIRKDGAPLTIRPFCNEEARIIGAATLTGADFAPVTDSSALRKIQKDVRQKIRQISLPEHGITEYGEITPVNYGESSPVAPELFINRKAMTLARWPDYDYARIENVTEQTDSSFTFTVLNGNDRVKNWNSAEDAWLYGFWYWDWLNEGFKMKSVNVQTGEVTAGRSTQVRAGQRFYIYNLLEELDRPGEFYLDRRDGTLYIYPSEELSGDDDVLLSLNTEPLLRFDYTSNIHIKGLEIGYTRGKGIVTNRAKNVSLERCTILCTGQIGIYAEESSDFTVSGSTITETGAGGILCSGGDFTTLKSSGNVLTNNHIYSYSRLIKSYTPAFRIAGVGTVVSHNLIHDEEHNAIMYGGNNHIIEYNEIYNVCTATDDAGAIYTGLSWTDRGNVVRYNYLHDIVGPGGSVGVSGVYLDDMHSSTEIYGNIFYRVSRAVLIGGGRDNTVENNLILEAPKNSNASIVIDQRGTEQWFSQNIAQLKSFLNNVPYRSELWRNRYPSLYNILDNNPAQPWGNTVRNNIIYRHKEMGISSLAERYGNIEDNWISNQNDIGFVDYSNKNFAIKPDSEIYKKIPEFTEIPIEKIGLLNE